ncbi:hypothetical protein DFJ43DRAFT_423193 [Lentinula guzmanii]|uniref:Uncharacterized protein n=1 Tax=Lentinula guzmanii TaxID=2804957 RepID=A0AA38N005_9AGAR|nr:hypothetical protein DFJ43DRAFT_423193 [Lentinula guzmanii]
MSSTEVHQQNNTSQDIMVYLRPMYARVLVDKRKRKVEEYCVDECRKRNLTGTPKVIFWCRYSTWVQNNISETNQMYIHNPFRDKCSEAKVLSADRDAWKEFIEQQFPDPSACIQNTNIRTNEPSPSKGTNESSPPIVTNDMQDVRDNQPIDMRDSKPLPAKGKAEMFVRKLGWRKASEQALLKGVLVANAIKFSIRYRPNKRSSASSGKLLLEKESYLIYSTSKA